MKSVSNTKIRKPVAPDGGWGWMVVLGSAMVTLATRALEPSFGLLFGDLLETLNVETTGAAIINSTLDSIVNFSGIFVGPLIQSFSFRKVSLVGSALYALGLMATAPAASMGHILTTYSIIGGLGVGLSSSATFVALNHYFQKKRGQAVGLSMAGAAVGMLAMPQAVRILLEVYGFRGALLILGGVALHAVVGSALLQPVKRYLRIAPTDAEARAQEMTTIRESDDESADAWHGGGGGGPDGLGHDQTKPLHSPLLPNSGETRGLRNTPTVISISGGAGGVAGLHNRRRKASVMSNLSAHMDFTGSSLHITSEVNDSDDEDQGIHMMRRVYSHAGHLTAMSKEAPSIKRNMSDQRLPVNYFNSKSFPRASLKKQAIKPDTETADQVSAWKKITSMMDLNLLRDGVFLNILLGLSLFYVAEQNFKMVTPFFLHSLGYDRNDVAYCLSMTAISDILARVALPPMFDRLNVPRRLVFLVSALGLGVIRTVLVEQTEWIPIMAWLSVSGFFRGAALSNFTLTISEHCSLEKLPAAFGLHMVAKGLFVVALGPLLGIIRDTSGSYPWCVHSQTLLILLCGVAWAMEYVILCCRRKTSKEIDTKN